MERQAASSEWMTPTDLLSGYARGTVSLLLRAEGAAITAVAIIAYRYWGGGIGFFLATFLVPDLFMAAYLRGTRLGAAAYNAAHTYLCPTVLASVGVLAGWPVLVALAAVWTAHIGFDRLLGYGLKYPDDFGHTHLGLIGKLRTGAGNR